MPEVSLASLNAEMEKYGIGLVKGDGHFRFVGLNPSMSGELARLGSTCVYVDSVGDLSRERWMDEMKRVLHDIRNNAMKMSFAEYMKGLKNGVADL